MRNKKAQQTMGMPFGMIFAIILIVVFFVVAFIAVGYFLNLKKSVSVGLFYDELEKAVDNAVGSQESDSNFKMNLPSGIEEVCFGNLSATITNNPNGKYDEILNYDVYDANVFLVPPEKAQNMQWKLIKRINITKTTEMENPYCVNVDSGLTIHKSFYDRLVWVE